MLSSKKAFSILDLLITIFIMAILAKIALPNWKTIDSAAENSSNQLVGYFKQVRLKALSTTRAYKISAINTTSIIAQYANTCSASTWTSDSSLNYTLANGATLGSIIWTVCFDSYGLSSSSTSFTINQIAEDTETIQVVLGGAVRKL